MSVVKGYWRLLGLSGVFLHNSGMEGSEAIPEARLGREKRTRICEVTLNGPEFSCFRCFMFQKHPDPAAKYKIPLKGQSSESSLHLFLDSVNHFGFEQILFQNSVISPLSVKSGHCDSDTQNLPLVFPKLKPADQRKKPIHHPRTFIFSCLSVRSAFRKMGRETIFISIFISLSLYLYLLMISPGGNNLQKAAMLGCPFPLSEG